MELMQKALNVVDRWTAKEGLSINPHKTAAVRFTNRKIIEGLGPLTLHQPAFAENTHEITNYFCDNDAHVVQNGASDLMWCIGCIPGLLDLPYSTAPWFGGPRLCKTPP
jgi:hypothetical protein